MTIVMILMTIITVFMTKCRWR